MKIYHYILAKLSRYIKFFFVLLFLGFLLHISSSLVLLISYPSPKTMSCAEFYQNPSSQAWLKLHDCNVDFKNVLTVSKTHLGVSFVQSIIIPVFPAGIEGASANGKLFIKNNDPEVLKYFSNDSEQTNIQTEVLLAKTFINYMGSELTGLVLDTEKVEVADSAGVIHKIDVYPIQYDAKPTWPLTEFLWLLALMAIFSLWFLRKKHRVTQSP